MTVRDGRPTTEWEEKPERPPYRSERTTWLVSQTFAFGMKLNRNLITLLLLVFTGTCRNIDQPAPLPTRNTPVPEKRNPASEKAADTTRAVGEVNPIKKLLSAPMLVRYETPGSVRWVTDLDAPITNIRWSPLKGFSVSAGNDVYNVTTRGEHRWRVVAGAGHKLFGLGDIEAVWSPAFGRINQLRRRGMIGWTREVDGRFVEDDRGAVYLLDASAVSALREDGKDKWRVFIDGVRRIEGLFNCGDAILVNGITGLKRVAVHISSRGSIVHTTPLGRGALLLGAGARCEPLVWRDGTLSLLNRRGYPIWKRPYHTAPFVHRLPEGFAVIKGNAGLPAQIETIDLHGRTHQRSELPVTGRLTRTQVIPRAAIGVEAIGLCLDVTNPCAKPSGNRGPFNALVTADGKGGFRTLIRHNAGHLAYATYQDGAVITASSKDPHAVDVVFRKQDQSVSWQLTLPGRLSAGPYVGPYGAVYVATCSGWACEKPYRMYSITAVEPSPESEEEASDND